MKICVRKSYTSSLLKTKWKIIWLISLAVVILAGTDVLAGVLRPANPIMDYVPQNYGRYDTYYDNCTETDCRTCHSASTAERHHATQEANQGQCLNCHCDYPNLTPPERDCLACHVDNAKFCGSGKPQGGDFGFPHHRSDLSGSLQCTGCHQPKFLVETFTVDPPAYPATSITPTPFACENCHWPTGKFYGEVAVYEPANQSPTLTDQQRSDRFLQDWLTWPDNVVRNNLGDGNAFPGDGWPKPTYRDGIGADPQPIGPSGAFYWTNWDLHPSKPYIPPADKQLHMQDSIKIWMGMDRCHICHGSSPSSSTSWSPQNPYLIRYCEACHSIGTLHNIADMVVDNDIYTVGGVLDQPITANEKCVACHGDALTDLPDPEPKEPILIAGSPAPSFGSPGIIVQLHGSYFDEEHYSGNWVKMRRKKGTGTEWVEVPIYSWSNNLIEIFVPGGSFWGNLPYNSKMKVKASGGTSTFQNFTVRKHPEIFQLTPPAGTWTEKITVDGVGFYQKQEKIYFYGSLTNKEGYGFSTYVELHASNDKYRAAKYVKAGNWTSSQFFFKLNPGTVFDIQTGVAVPDPALFEGTWSVMVVTDYFKDDGDKLYFDNSTGACDIGQVFATDGGDGGGYVPLAEAEPFNALDGPNGTSGTTWVDGDILLHRERSEVATFDVIHQPILNKLKPRLGAYHNNKVKAIGYGFGTQTGEVWLGKNAKLGKDELFFYQTGDTIPAGYAVGDIRSAADLDNAGVKYKSLPIRSWGTTMVKFKFKSPKANTSKKVGKRLPVRIIVPNAGESSGKPGATNAKSVKYLGLP